MEADQFVLEVNWLVMMSFKLKRIFIPVKKKDREKKLDMLKKAFGTSLKIYIEGKYVVIEGKDLKDYRIRDKVYEMMEME